MGVYEVTAYTFECGTCGRRNETAVFNTPERAQAENDAHAITHFWQYNPHTYVWELVDAEHLQPPSTLPHPRDAMERVRALRPPPPEPPQRRRWFR